jgi:hypothetical protein
LERKAIAIPHDPRKKRECKHCYLYAEEAKTFRGEDFSPNDGKIPHKGSDDANPRSGGDMY